MIDVMHYVYLLKLKNTKKNFYIGCTSDLKRRMSEHKSGKTKTTRGKNPELIYYEAFLDRNMALKKRVRSKE